MNDDEETAYTMGHDAAWRTILGEAIRALGIEGDTERWRLERADTVNALRSLCAVHGDNDWPSDLHLADVINKHLFNYLESKTAAAPVGAVSPDLRKLIAEATAWLTLGGFFNPEDMASCHPDATRDLILNMRDALASPVGASSQEPPTS